MSNRFFSIRNIAEVRTEESDEFFYARLCVLSTRPNSHKVLITRDILMRDGDSIRGKWVVANPKDGEFMSHDDEEVIVGIIPADARIDYVDDTDGNTYMYVDAVLSKIYAKAVYDMFKSNNFRNVSVEMATADRDTLDDGSIPIDGLKIYGVTILGALINGSCPDANMKIVQFSDINAEKYYKTFSDEPNSANGSEQNKEFENMEEKTKAMSEEEKVMAEVEPKEEQKEMSEEPKEEKDMAEKDEAQNADEEKEMAEQPKEESDEEKEMAEPKSDDSEEDKKEMSEDSDKDDDDKAEEDDDKDFACLENAEKEMSETVRNVFSQNKEFAVKSVLSMATELKELREFKEKVEQKEKAFAVDNVMASVKSVLTEKEFSDFKEEGLSCDNIDAFTNKIKAFAFDKKQESVTNDNGGIMEFSDSSSDKEQKELTADEIFNKYM